MEQRKPAPPPEPEHTTPESTPEKRRSRWQTWRDAVYQLTFGEHPWRRREQDEAADTSPEGKEKKKKRRLRDRIGQWLSQTELELVPIAETAGATAAIAPAAAEVGAAVLPELAATKPDNDQSPEASAANALHEAAPDMPPPLVPLSSETAKPRPERAAEQRQPAAEQESTNEAPQEATNQAEALPPRQDEGDVLTIPLHPSERARMDHISELPLRLSAATVAAEVGASVAPAAAAFAAGEMIGRHRNKKRRAETRATARRVAKLEQAQAQAEQQAQATAAQLESIRQQPVPEAPRPSAPERPAAMPAGRPERPQPDMPVPARAAERPQAPQTPSREVAPLPIPPQPERAAPAPAVQSVGEILQQTRPEVPTPKPAAATAELSPAKARAQAEALAKTDYREADLTPQQLQERVAKLAERGDVPLERIFAERVEHKDKDKAAALQNAGAATGSNPAPSPLALANPLHAMHQPTKPFIKPSMLSAAPQPAPAQAVQQALRQGPPRPAMAAGLVTAVFIIMVLLILQ